MLAFNRSVPSLPLIPLSPLLTSLSLLILLFFVPCLPSLKCRRRGAAGRLRRRFGSQGAATTPGAATQRPARALPRPGPHAPISEEPLGGVGGKSAERKEGSERRVFAVAMEADGDEKAEQRLSFYGAVIV